MAPPEPLFTPKMGYAKPPPPPPPVLTYQNTWTSGAIAGDNRKAMGQGKWERIDHRSEHRPPAALTVADLPHGARGSDQEEKRHYRR